MDPGSADQLRARCPVCGHDAWAKRSGEWTLAGRILKLRPDGSFVVVCDRCKTSLPVPFLGLREPPEAPSTPAATGPRKAIVRSRLTAAE